MDSLNVDTSFPFQVLLECSVCGRLVANALTGRMKKAEWIAVIEQLEPYICGQCQDAFERKDA